ncbi:MAG: alpha-amylase family glycosyl hydrolase [Anaerolineae bacterium]
MSDNIFGTLGQPNERLDRAKAKTSAVKHLYRRTPLDPVPGQPLMLLLTTDGALPYGSARCYFTVDGSDPDGPHATCQDLEMGEVEWSELDWGYVRSWVCRLPPQPARTLLRYRLAAQRADTGELVFADNQASSLAAAQDFCLWIDDDPPPAWSREALVYHVFLDRFYPGDGRDWKQPATPGGFYGGTLQGVIDKLDYIQSFGFNTIWLSPFFPSNSHHGYNATDTYSVEPRLGTAEDLQRLIATAHARGMRLVMDLVANHWSKDHPTFQDARRNPDSPYHDWYTWRHWPDEYASYFGVKELPTLNLNHSQARQYMLDCARFWLRQGFDGLRLDYAQGPSQDFWVDFRVACRQERPDCWIFGEIVYTAELQRSYSGIMDGTLDFLLAKALRETFAEHSRSLSSFEAFLSAHEAYFGGEFSRPSFLDNHDMTRFLYLAGGDKDMLKLAALVQYTLSGPPIVYNGTESGTTQERPLHQGQRDIYEEARLPVKWDSAADSELLAFYRRLGSLRQSNPVLREGSRRLDKLDDATGIYAYLRELGEAKVLVAVNLGSKPQSIILPPGLETAREHLASLPLIHRAGSASLSLPPHAGAFIG